MKRAAEPTLKEYLHEHYIKYKVENEMIILQDYAFFKCDFRNYYHPSVNGYYIVDPDNCPVDSLSSTLGVSLSKSVRYAEKPMLSFSIQGPLLELSGKLSETIMNVLRAKDHFKLENRNILPSGFYNRVLKPEHAEHCQFLEKVDIPESYRLIHGDQNVRDRLNESMFCPTVRDFLRNNSIDFISINLKITQHDGVKKKQLIPYENSTMYGNSNWLYKREEGENRTNYNKYRMKVSSYKYLAHSTKQYNINYIIDIDCLDISEEVKGWLRHYPYYKSSTKPYGYHIFIRTLKYKPQKQIRKFTKKYGSKIELLSGMWSFAPRDGPVYNADQSMGFDLTEEMLESPKQAKKTSQVPRVVKNVNYDAVQDDIIKYLQDRPVLKERHLEYLNFEPYDNDMWQINIKSTINGYCPEHALLRESKKVIQKVNGEPLNMILNFIRQSLTNHSFLDKVDTDATLLAFSNGVLDLTTYKMVETDKLLMKKCDYDFHMATLEEIEECKRKIRPLFSSVEEMDFRMAYVAKSLIRSTNDELLLVETGRSDILRFIEQTVLGSYMTAISPDTFLCRKTQARNEKNIDVQSARSARLWVCNHLELNKHSQLDRTQLHNFNLRLKSRSRLNYDNDMVTFTAPPIILSLLDSPVLPYIPGLCLIKYHYVDEIKDELAENPSVYMSMLLQYLQEYRQYGITVPKSIKEKTNMCIKKNFKTWIDYYFEEGNNNIYKRSLHAMYNDTVGSIEQREFTQMLKDCGYNIHRGCYGHELVKDDYIWYEVKSKKINDVIKNITLKQ
eukprot:g13281.t1